MRPVTAPQNALRRMCDHPPGDGPYILVARAARNAGFVACAYLEPGIAFVEQAQNLVDPGIVRRDRIHEFADLIDDVLSFDPMQLIQITIEMAAVELDHKVPAQRVDQPLDLPHLVDFYRPTRQLHDARPARTQCMP